MAATGAAVRPAAASRRGWRGLAILGKPIVGALFVIQLLFVAGTPAVWLL